MHDWDAQWEDFEADKGTCTWPTLGPMALIPLDHVLIAGGITAEHVNTFEIPGSDHRGLVSNIILPEHAR